MSSWNVIPVPTPIMMRLVKMYITVIVTLIPTIAGLPQTCLQYCKLSPVQSSTPSPECDCSFYNIRKPHSTATILQKVIPSIIKDSEIDFEAENIDPSPSNVKYNNNRTAYESFEEKDVNDNNISYTIKNNNIDMENTIEDTIELPLRLYLDIEVGASNTSQLEQLKTKFKNFQDIEKDLSDCINLHIYIFSNYINKTNANWGYETEHDNLSSFQAFTEIQNKCGEPTSIIKESIYEINQNLPWKIESTEIVHDGKNIIKSIEPKNDQMTQNKHTFNNTRISTNTHNVTPETDTEEYPEIQFDKQYKKDGDVSLFTSTYDNNIILNPKLHNASIEALVISELNRTTYNETDILIPRIITKELSNSSVLSIVDGNEEIPNSDFVTPNIISSTSDENTISNDRPTLNISLLTGDLMNTNIDNMIETNLVEIHGNLFFNLGEKQIPARFIQQQNGELNIAIDGFSLCNEMLQQNASSFMNSLCKCIQLQN